MTQTPPPPPGGPPARPVPPRPVRQAFVVLLGALALVIAAAAVSIPMALNTAQVLGSGTSANGVTSSDTASAIAGGLIAGLVVQIIGALVAVAFVFAMRAGRNWARILLTVFGLIRIPWALIAFRPAGQPVGPLDLTFFVLAGGGVALTVVAVVLMFRPASNAYVRETGAWRALTRYADVRGPTPAPPHPTRDR